MKKVFKSVFKKILPVLKIAVFLFVIFAFLSSPLPVKKFKIPEVYAVNVVNGDGIITYGISGDTTPRWRSYSKVDDVFTAATPTIAGGIGSNFVTRTSPTTQEAISVYADSSNVLRVICYDGTSWTNEWSVTVGGDGIKRPFDVAYETNTGDVIVVYSRNVAATNALDYRTKPGSTGCGTANWATAASMPTTVAETTGTVQWVKAAWDKRSAQNLIAAIWADSNSDLGAAIWSGTAFGGFPTAALSTTLDCFNGTGCVTSDIEAWDVEYESLSGDVMVTWGDVAGANGTNGAFYGTCTGGTSTCTWGIATAIPLLLDDATMLDLSSNPNTDEMLFASVGVTGADLQAQYWNGTDWLASCTLCANTDISASAPFASGVKPIATGWLISGATTRGVLVYNDSASTDINWFTFTGSAFTAQTDFVPTPVFGSPQIWYDIQTDPFNKDRFILTVSDANSDLFANSLLMTATPSFTWNSMPAALQINLPLPVVSRPFSFAYWRFIPPTTIGDGINPGNTTLAPGASITDLDAFTLAIYGGTDWVTAATVTLSSGSSGGLSEVRITSDDGVTLYFTAITPASDTLSFSGGTAIPVTTTATQFKVRITPKSHANMSGPPGSSYAVTGTVTAFTSTNPQSGSDSGSATVTIDNLSPGAATGISGSVASGKLDVIFTKRTGTTSAATSTIQLKDNAAIQKNVTVSGQGLISK